MMGLDVLPATPRRDVANCARVDTVLSRQVDLAGAGTKAGLYYADLRFREARGVDLFASGFDQQPRVDRVGIVRFLANPLQIVGTIIRLVTVYVVDGGTLFRSRHERQCDQAMNADAYGAPFVAERDHRIAGADGLSQPNIAALFVANAAKVRDLVAVKAGSLFPAFFHAPCVAQTGAGGKL